MALSAGDKLGAYEIVSKLGAGGMGEVYRARDAKLNRDVAIKVLPAALSNDAQYMARFEREAQMLAALNHPNIATVYGIEQGALVMELIEGADLKGPLPIDEALAIARQIAAGLEAAHEKGIIHRDLKPANIKITPAGVVKILDFGLAKSAEPGAAAGSSATMSPTLSMEMTRAGMILGTAAYMSPEQARGKPLDKRTDIWAFGVVLYEIVTGKQLFEGEDLTEILAKVVRDRVDLNGVPAKLRPLLERCLEKDPKKRLRDIGDMELLLGENGGTAGPALAAGLPQRNWALVAAGVLGLGLAALAAVHFRELPPETPTPVKFHLAPENAKIGASYRFALSPDGTKLAYYATGSDGTPRLWVRSMDTLESRALSATDLTPSRMIFWSFDSRFVAFPSGEKLKKIDVSGGPAQTLCDAPGIFYGGSWNRDGTILFATGLAKQLMRVSSEGGTATPVASAGPPAAGAYRGPVFLPDGQHFLYWSALKPDATGVYLGALDGKPGQAAARRLLATDQYAQFVPLPDGSSGRILFLREGTLLAQPFDLRRLELAGEAVPVAEQVTRGAAGGQFSASRNGALVYRTGEADAGARLTWFDRQGKTVGTPTGADYLSNNPLALSPERYQGGRTESRRAREHLVGGPRAGRKDALHIHSIRP
ncbi:MAG: protein kinase domain-containing protein [Bryobacteraceae bacterium]